MAISEAKIKIVIDNYFKKECDVNTSIREAFEKGFRIGVLKGMETQSKSTDDAIPLDDLCEMLTRANVPVPCNNNCENCAVFDGTGNTVNCWKKIMSEWMANY